MLRLYTTSCFKAITEPFFKGLKKRKDGDEPELESPHPLPITIYFLNDALNAMRIHREQESYDHLNSSISARNQEEYALVSDEEAATALVVPGDDDEDVAIGNGRGKRSPSVLHRQQTRLLRQQTRLLHHESRHRSTTMAERLGLSSSAAGSSGFKPTVLWRGLRNLAAPPKFMRGGGTTLGPSSTTKQLKVAISYGQAEAPKEVLLFRLDVQRTEDMGVSLSFLSAYPSEEEYLYPPMTLLKRPKWRISLWHERTRYTVLSMEPSIFPPRDARLSRSGSVRAESIKLRKLDVERDPMDPPPRHTMEWRPRRPFYTYAPDTVPAGWPADAKPFISHDKPWGWPIASPMASAASSLSSSSGSCVGPLPSTLLPAKWSMPSSTFEVEAPLVPRSSLKISSNPSSKIPSSKTPSSVPSSVPSLRASTSRPRRVSFGGELHGPAPKVRRSSHVN